jgi:hypothetical protein
VVRSRSARTRVFIIRARRAREGRTRPRSPQVRSRERVGARGAQKLVLAALAVPKPFPARGCWRVDPQPQMMISPVVDRAVWPAASASAERLAMIREVYTHDGPLAQVSRSRER